MAKTKYIIEARFDRPKIETVDAATVERGNTSKVKVRLGLHTPKWTIKSCIPEWEMTSRSAAPTGLSEFTLVFTYSGTIQISKVIDKSSKCYKLASEHEAEHETICVDGTRAATRECEKILQKHVEAILKKTYRGDVAKAHDDGQAFGKSVGIAAFSEMQDGPFLAIAKKSAAIDTPSTYAPIDAACAEYG